MREHLQPDHTPSSMSPPPVPDPEATALSGSELTRLHSDSCSSITVDRSKELPSPHCLDAVQTDWTDEKHRLYLDSLEASFVQELHQYGHFHALSSKQQMRRKQIMPNISSSELVVLQDASWQKVNFGRNDPLWDRTADSPAILEDLWISHFPSAGKQCTLETPDLLEERGSYNDRRHLRNRNMTTSCGSARRSQQIPTCCRDSVTIITEFSDQNFVDNHPGELSGGMSNAKRLKKATADSSSNNQAVPYKRLSSER